MSKLEQGKALLKEDKHKEAIVLLNEFLIEFPNHADALFFRGICHRKLGDFSNSVMDFTAVINKLPDEASIYSERGVSYYHQKNYKAALDDLNKAVELEPNKPYRYSSRAYIRAYTDVDGAIDDYEKAIELDPNDEIAYNNLGLLLENQGNMREAQKNFQKSNEIIGYNPEKRNKVQEENHAKTENEEKSSIGKIMLDVFRDKNTRKEFLEFLKSGFKRKEE